MVAFMEVLNIFLILLGICGSCSGAEKGTDTLSFSENSRNGRRMTVVAHTNLSVENSVALLNQKIEKQQESIAALQEENKVHKTEIKELQLVVATLGNKQPVYRKLIPADVVAWLSFGVAIVYTSQVYDGNVIIAITAFLPTLMSFYWVLKNIREQASVATHQN